MGKDNNQGMATAPSFSESLVDAIRQAEDAYRRIGDAGALFELLLESLVSLADSEFGFLAEVLGDGSSRRTLARSEELRDEDTLRRFADLVGRSGTARDTGGALRAGESPVRACLGLPVRFGGEVVGVAGIANRPGGYPQDFADDLEPFLSTCACIIHLARQRDNEKKLLEELEDSRRMTAAILRASSESSFLIDTDGIVLNGNDVFARRLGYEIDQLIGTNIFDYLPKDVVESRREKVKEALRFGRPLLFEDKREDRIFRNRLVPIPDHSGAVHRIAVFSADITERKRLEEQRRECLLREAESVKAANVGLWDWDLTTDKVRYSVEWKRQIGYEDDEIGEEFEEWRSRVHPDDLEKTFATVQEGIRTLSTEFESRFRFRHKDGSYRWILAQGSVLADESGAPARMLGSHIDITRLVTAEEMAERQRREVELTLDATADGVWKWDFARSELEFSPRYYAMLGYEPGEFPAGFENWKALIHPDDVDRAVSVATEYLRTKPDSYENEFRLRAKSGSYRWIKSRARVVERAEDGEALRMIGNHQDITERKRLEQTLQAANREKETILDCTVEMFSLYDLDLKVVWANRSAGELVGCAKEDLVGRHCYEIWSGGTTPCEDCPVLRAKETKTLQETKRRTPDGRVWHLRGYPILDDDGEVVNLVEFGRDITEAERVEDRNRTLAEMVDSAPNSVTIHDAEGRFLYANRKTFELHGYTAEEFFALNLHDLDVPEDEAKIDARIREIVERGESTFEVGHYCKDGSVLPLEVSVTPIVWEGQQGLLSIGRDVTERKVADEDLRRSEASYRALAEAIPDLLFKIDKDLRFAFIHAGRTEKLLVPKEEALGKTVYELLPPDLAALTARNVEAALRSSEIREYGYSLPMGEVVQHYEARLVPCGSDEALALVRNVSEQKRLMDELRWQEEWFRGIYENNPIGIALVDPDTQRFLKSNRTYQTLLGYSEEELRSLSVMDVTHAEDWERERAFVSQKLTGETDDFALEKRYIRKDGSIRWVSVTGELIKDPSGRSLALATVVDLTERRRAEEALRMAEAGTRSILTSVADTFFSLDPEWRFAAVNPAAERAPFGRQASELVGETIWALFPALVDTAMYRLCLDARDNRSTEHCEVRSPLDDRCYEVFAKGWSGGTDVYMRDITEQRLFQESLNESQKRLDLAIRAIGAGVWDWDVVQNRMIWDERMLELYGLSPEQFTGDVQSWTEGLHPEDRAAAIADCDSALRGEKPFNTEFRIMRPNGEVRFIKADAAVLRDEAGMAVRMIGLNHDITDRKRAEGQRAELEGQLQQAMKMEAVGRLAGGVAHDFNNLLTSIIGNVQLSLMDLRPGDPLGESLTEISQAAESAASLTRQLLAFSRKQIIEPRVVTSRAQWRGVAVPVAASMAWVAELT